MSILICSKLDYFFSMQTSFFQSSPASVNGITISGCPIKCLRIVPNSTLTHQQILSALPQSSFMLFPSVLCWSELLLSQFSSAESLNRVQFFVTPWTAACQASLSITNSQSLLKLMSIESMMPSNHLILCHPLLLLPSIFPSISVFFRVRSSHQVAKVFELQHQSFQWIFRTYFL